MSPARPEPEQTDAVTSDLPTSVTKPVRLRPVGLPRLAVRISVLITLCLLLSHLLGCGGGIRAFSGGGFPIGKSVVVGKAVASEDPLIVYKGVRIILQASPGNGTNQRFETTTDTNGNFEVDDIPTGQTSGVVQMTAIPSDPNVRQQSLTFLVTNGRKRGVFLSLPRISFDVARAKSLTFSTPSVTLPPGDTVRLDAQVRDNNSVELPVVPSLVYDAELGTIGGDGTFFGLTEGTGNVTALWYNNLSATASVTVDADAPSVPPPPPRDPKPTAP